MEFLCAVQGTAYAAFFTRTSVCKFRIKPQVCWMRPSDFKHHTSQEVWNAASVVRKISPFGRTTFLVT